jgi:hypothetical protein
MVNVLYVDDPMIVASVISNPAEKPGSSGSPRWSGSACGDYVLD